MKEIPLLFSTPMVQALLAGRKTQTRRIIKHKLQPVRDEVISSRRMVKPSGWPLMNFDEYTERFCPYGKPGDLIWVRETWAPYLRGTDGDGFVELIKYKADGAEIAFKHVKDYAELGWHNRPGIHMNKEYARIWLQVTDIRVERLQDISEEDAVAEGIGRCAKANGEGCGYFDYSGVPTPESYNWGNPIDSFRTLWISINGAESWATNPFVWAVSFKGLSTTGKAALLTETSNNE